MTTLFSPFRDLELATRPASGATGVQRIPFDAARTDDSVVLLFDLPGFDPDQVDLSVDRNVLTVSARRERDLPEGSTLVVSERRQGAVRRQLRFSDSLDLSAVDARFDNGVLRVRIPVNAAAQPHRVPITVGSTPLETDSMEADGDAGQANQAHSAN